MAKKSSNKSVAKKKSTPKKKDSSLKQKSVKNIETENLILETQTPLKILSIKEILFEKFEDWKPGKIFVPPVDQEYLTSFTSPPFFIYKNEQELEKIKKLLFKNLEEEVKEEVKEIKEIKEEIKEEVKKEIKEEIKEEVKEEVKEEIKEEIKEEVKEEVKEEIKEEVKEDPILVQKASIKEIDFMKKNLIFASFCISSIYLLLIIASALNMNNYYIKPIENGMEIWRGTFAPMGEEFFIKLTGITPPKCIKKVYKKEEVFPYIFRFFNDKAKKLAIVSGIPDFDQIKYYLNQALFYAVSEQLKINASSHINKIDAMVLSYKAYIEASIETLDGFNKAKEYLKKAQSIMSDDILQKELIEKKIKTIDEKISKISLSD